MKRKTETTSLGETNNELDIQSMPSDENLLEKTDVSIGGSNPTNQVAEKDESYKDVSKQFGSQSKLSKSNYAMITTHGISQIESIFVSTFLMSYIYSTSENYLFNIGLFYAMQYVVMAGLYFLLSMIIDRTNRVIIYKISLIVRGLFMLSVVLVGKDLAMYVALAGALHGVSEAFYWTSYNLMKNELIPNKFVKTHSTIQFSIKKTVSIVVPVVFGKIIDAESFKVSAIIVLAIVLIQIIVSLFIKSKKPENSTFNMREFFADMKGLGEKFKPIKWIFIASIAYGFTTAIGPINTIMIMYSFNSNFSLGILTSLFSVFSMILLIILNRFLYPGKKHKTVNILTAILSPAFALLAIFWTTKLTIAIYVLSNTVLLTVHEYYFDVYRNMILKKYGLYHDIAEYQCCIELILEISRIVSFVIMLSAGLIALGFGTAGMLIATKIILGSYIFAITALNIILVIIDKLFKRYELL